MFQDGQSVCFRSGGDPARVRKVQLATGKDRFRVPRVVPTNDLNATQVQVVVDEDEDRYPFIRPFPANIGEPAAWFQMGRGITITGSGVSQWDDVSGNGRHLKQGTDGNRPALQADGSILFDGVDNYLKCDAFTLNQPESVYLLLKQVSWTSGDRVFDGNASSSGMIVQTAATPGLTLTSDNVNFVTRNDALALNTYGVVACVINGASSLTRIGGTITTGNAGAGNMGGFTLASLGAGNFGWSHIQVKEVVLFPANHSTAQQSSVIQYLMGVGGVS